MALALSSSLALSCAHSTPQDGSRRVEFAHHRHAPVHAQADRTIVLASAPDGGAISKLPGPAAGPVPDYDRFTSPDGHITNIEKAWAMAQSPEQVERLYADAIKGDPRATTACLDLESYFRAIGTNVATSAGTLDCLLLPAPCQPDWGFLGFLSRTRPGGIRLREMIRDGFQARAKELALENRLVVNVINLLMAGVIVSHVATVARSPATALPAAMSADARMVPNIAMETTKLYRAVSEAELNQILETGRFQPGPNSLGGKWFAESAEDAAKWGTLLSGPGKFRVIEVELPKPVADKLIRRPRLDSIGPARYGEPDQLEGAVIREVE
ncbi:MAG TPA: hypothetical protein VFA20_31830 [Myxococcaceae bacterium]|nr:hypothetical protein [Myxococcaceae bacterium]